MPVKPLWLSEREKEVLGLLGERRDCGAHLSFQSTMRNYVGSIFKKLEAEDRMLAAVLGIRCGPVDLSRLYLYDGDSHLRV